MQTISCLLLFISIQCAASVSGIEIEEKIRTVNSIVAVAAENVRLSAEVYQSTSNCVTSERAGKVSIKFWDQASRKWSSKEVTCERVLNYYWLDSYRLEKKRAALISLVLSQVDLISGALGLAEKLDGILFREVQMGYSLIRFPVKPNFPNQFWLESLGLDIPQFELKKESDEYKAIVAQSYGQITEICQAFRSTVFLKFGFDKHFQLKCSELRVSMYGHSKAFEIRRLFIREITYYMHNKFEEFKSKKRKEFFAYFSESIPISYLEENQIEGLNKLSQGKHLEASNVQSLKVRFQQLSEKALRKYFEYKARVDEVKVLLWQAQASRDELAIVYNELIQLIANPVFIRVFFSKDSIVGSEDQLVVDEIVQDIERLGSPAFRQLIVVAGGIALCSLPFKRVEKALGGLGQASAGTVSKISFIGCLGYFPVVGGYFLFKDFKKLLFESNGVGGLHKSENPISLESLMNEAQDLSWFRVSPI